MSNVPAVEAGSTASGRRWAKTGPGDGDAYWFYGDLAVIRSPDGAMPIIIEHHLAVGSSAPLHVHHDVDDSFYLLSGQLALRCGDETFVARAGDYVSLPKGVPHTQRVLGEEGAVLLQTHDGPAFVNFIRRVGTPASQPMPDPSTLDFAALNKVAAETGQPVLGPPMSAEEAATILATARS